MDQIIIGKLGCGVTVKRGGEFFGVHTEPVIADEDQAFAAITQVNLDRPRLGIKGIFDQFLDRRSRAFNDFAGGNLVDQMIG
jgi:hypothetical protein